MAEAPDIIRSKDMLCGEIDRKGIVVTSNSDFIIASGTYQVFKKDGTPLNILQPAVVSGNTVYANVQAPNSKGEIYVEFTYYVDNLVKKARLVFNVI